jgi:hypothetical protein
MNNIPEGYENDPRVTGEEVLSPEEQVRLAEAEDTDDDSDDELPDLSETTEDPLKEIGD